MDEALVAGQDLVHMKKEYIDACKELKRIVHRSAGGGSSAYNSITASSIAEDYDSAAGPLTDRYFRGPGGGAPKRRKSKVELHSYSATSYTISKRGKDLDDFIEKNNCF